MSESYSWGERPVRFPDARCAAHHQIGLALEELTASQVPNMLLVQLRHVGEPVGGPLLDHWELGPFPPSFDRSGGRLFLRAASCNPPGLPIESPLAERSMSAGLANGRQGVGTPRKDILTA